MNFRKCLAKFRVSSHKLRIETVRYQKPTLFLDDRLCEFCNDGNIDEESNLLTACGFHDEERLNFYKRLNKNINDLKKFTKHTIYLHFPTTKIDTPSLYAACSGRGLWNPQGLTSLHLV